MLSKGLSDAVTASLVMPHAGMGARCRGKEAQMARAPSPLIQAVPAPALRASLNKVARCQHVAELTHRLHEPLGLVAERDLADWLAACQPTDGRGPGPAFRYWR